MIGANDSQCLFPDPFAAVGKWFRRCLTRVWRLCRWCCPCRPKEPLDVRNIRERREFTVVIGAPPRHAGPQTMTAPAHPPELGPLSFGHSLASPCDCRVKPGK